MILCVIGVRTLIASFNITYFKLPVDLVFFFQQRFYTQRSGKLFTLGGLTFPHLIRIRGYNKHLSEIMSVIRVSRTFVKVAFWPFSGRQNPNLATLLDGHMTIKIFNVQGS